MRRRRRDVAGRRSGPAGALVPAVNGGFLTAVERLGQLGSWTLEAATGALSCSAQLCELFDVDPQEATWGPGGFLSRVDRDDRPGVVEAVERCRSTGTAFSIGCSVVRGDGQRRSLVVRGERATDAGDAVWLRGIVQDITELVHADAGRLRDPLTGLPNRPWLYERAHDVFARAARRRWSTAILAIDLDEMHAINAAVGLVAGDAVLVEVGRRLREAFRPYDTVVRPVDETESVSRFGGDLFVVVCEDVDDVATTHALCRRVAAVLEPPVIVGDSHVGVTASVGVVLVPPGATDLDDRLVAAETAMRSAKANGGNGYGLFTPDMVIHGQRPQAESAELERALADGEFRLVYQPKAALDGSGLVGVEALLRWQHPSRGLVPPDEFIPLAERTGFIVPIGAWVIEEACRQAQRWQRPVAHRRRFTVSVNVSAVQLRPELVDVVRGALAATGVPSSSLRLELTETVVMDDIDAAMPVLLALAALGVSLSVDDFGTGHSSLAYLKRLPFDELKIDRSFVEGLGVDSDSAAIVAAVIAMSHALDLTVVAEGVETAEQLAQLHTLGCDEAQGFLIGRPVSPAVIDVRLRTGAPSDPENAAMAAQPTTSETSQRVLVVDDAVDVRQLASVSLAAAGFDVHEAGSGSEAVTLARRLRPACVLLDVEMPGLSGIEVCRSLRDHPATAGCTVVMLTSRADATDKVEAFAIGADDYIVKPFSPRELVSRVRAAMRLRALQPGNESRAENASVAGDDNGESLA